MSKSVNLKSAHVFLKDGRAVVASGWRVIQLEDGGVARVTFAGVRFRKAEGKPTRAGILSALGKGKA